SQVLGGGKRRVDGSWDAANRLAALTLDPNSLNRSSTFAYDAAGNVTSVTSADPSGRSEQTRYGYDGGSRLVRKVVDNGQHDIVTSYVYDQRGNLTGVVNPRANETGTTTGFTTEYGYDAAS